MPGFLGVDSFPILFNHRSFSIAASRGAGRFSERRMHRKNGEGTPRKMGGYPPKRGKTPPPAVPYAKKMEMRQECVPSKLGRQTYVIQSSFSLNLFAQKKDPRSQAETEGLSEDTPRQVPRERMGEARVSQPPSKLGGLEPQASQAHWRGGSPPPHPLEPGVEIPKPPGSA